MKDAITLAKEAVEADEIPVGCVIVKDGEIIAKTHNKTIQNNNPIAHAELLAIQQVGMLEGADIYVTLEPCAMCAKAISLARYKRLYFGAYDKKGGAVENGVRLYSSSEVNHKPEVYCGIMEDECSKLLKDYFQGKR